MGCLEDYVRYYIIKWLAQCPEHTNYIIVALIIIILLF